MLGLNHIARHIARRENQVLNALNAQDIINFNTLGCAEKKVALVNAANVFNTLASSSILNGNDRRIGHELISIASFGAADKILLSVDGLAASYIQYIWNSYSVKSLDRHDTERDFCAYFRKNLEHHIRVNL